MADKNNPIKYSDLIQPDNSISELIKQLETLQSTYSDALKNIKAEAIQLTQVLKGVSGATEAGRTATRKATEDADKLARAQKQQEFAYSETAKKIAELKQATKEQNDINRLVVKINNSAEGSYNRLSAQYSLNKIYLNNMTKAERENTAEGRELEQETKRIYEEMSRLQEATGKYQLNVGNYTNAIQDALGVNNQFGQSLIALGKGGEESKNALIAMKDGATALGKTLLGLLSNPVFLAIAGISGAGVAFKWWYDYNAGIQEATKLTAEFTGKSGDDLKAFRNEITAIADTFGKDWKETLQSTDTLAAQFGISFEEALKAIKDGFIAGADVNGDFLAKVKQYPAYFKEAGLSVQQFISIVTQTRSGIFGDQGLDAIKQANARIRELSSGTANALDKIGISSKQVAIDLANGTKTTFDILQDVANKLSQLPPSSKEVGEVLINVFGKQGRDAGLEMIKSLKDINTNIEEVKAQTGELGRLQEEQAQAEIDLQNALSALFDQTGGNFEKMTTRAKVFVSQGLTVIIKGVISLINYFIDLYNKSLLIRAVWNIIVANFKQSLDTLGNLFNYFINILKAVGETLQGIFTLDFDRFKAGLVDFATALPKMIRANMKDAAANFQEGLDAMEKKIKPITIPVSVETPTTPGAQQPQGGGATPTAIKETPKTKTSNAEAKAVEEAYKRRIEIIRKKEDIELKFVVNVWEQRRKEIVYQYSRQIEDIRHQLAVETKLTTEERKNLNDTIILLQTQQFDALLALEREQASAELQLQKETIELRLQAVKKGSEEERKLRLEQLDIEEKIAQAKNKAKPAEQQQAAADITASFDVKRAGIADEYMQIQMQIFDKQQELAQSEFDLLRTTEEKKTRFRLQAEKERLQKILELNKLAGTKLSDVEIATIQNTIARIEKEIDQTKSQERGRDIYGLFGLNLDTEQRQAIDESITFAVGQLTSYISVLEESANKAVELANREVQSTQARLNAEIEARNKGYANDVASAQKELALAKRTQEKALKEQQKAQKAQQAIQTIQQIGDLVTASAKIWAQLGFPYAIPAIALMWGSFAFAKIKAAQVAKQTETYGDGTVELLHGGSHQSGNDIDLGTKSDGTKRRAEGGEFFAVINKRNSRKFRNEIPQVINSLNDGTFAMKYMHAYDEGNAIVFNENPTDISELNENVRAMRTNAENGTMYDGRGNMIIRHKNLKQRIRP